MLERTASALEGRYEVLDEIGQGGMAHVFRARDIRHDREVALKVMRPEYAGPLGSERFLHEIGFAARLNHPSIVPLFDSGDADGVLFYTMPLLRGVDLRSVLVDRGPFPIDEALKIAMEVCDALAHAHAAKVTHRDVKPSNIFLSEGRALLMDFGIARAESDISLTSTGAIVGTPQYMAPEQAARDRVDERTDIYALGCVLYELLVGSPPFEGRTAISMQARHLKDPPPPITTVRDSVPHSVEAAVMRALEKTPADRFQSAEEFKAALAHGLDDLRAGASGRRPAGVSQEPSRRALFRNVAAAVVALGIGAAGWWLGTQGGGRAGMDVAGASIAVLAFQDLSAGGGTDYLGDGISEELIMGLSRVSGLKVAARTSAFAFKERSAVLPEIGQLLGVETVLEGSVRRNGDSLRVAARLMHAGSEDQLWSGEYRTTLATVPEVQDLLAIAVIEQLGLELDDGEVALITPGTASAEAYESYLQGRYFLGRRGLQLADAAPLFAHAIDLDPDYGQAHAALAKTYALLGLYSLAPADSVFPLAVAATERALALAPDNYDALAASGLIDMVWDYDWGSAEANLERAMAVNPGGPEARGWYSAYAVITRDDAEAALEHARVAMDNDPLSYAARINVHNALMLLDRTDESIELLEEGLQLIPESAPFLTAGLATAYGQAGDWERAVELWEPFVDASGRAPIFLSTLATLNALGGRTEDALALVDEMRIRSRRERVAAISFAHPLAASGRRAEALDWLESSVAQHEGTYFNMSLFKELRALADESRYIELRRMGGLDPNAIEATGR